MSPITLLSSAHLRKIGIGSLVFLLSGVGSLFAAAPNSNPGLFATYFQNIANNDCTGLNVLTGFDTTAGSTYLTKKCTSIGPIIGAFFGTQQQAPLGQAITGFYPTGAPKFGAVNSQWIGLPPGNISYTGANVGIGTPIPTQKLDVVGNIRTTGNTYINSTSPTVFFQDTDHRSAMMHVNSNQFYILRGDANNSLNYSAINGRWPLQIDLNNNNATFGGAGNFSGGLRVNSFIGSYGNGMSGYSFNAPGDTDGGMFSPVDGTLVFATNSRERVRIDNIGNVGIGTASPSTKLQVAGEVTSTSANAFRMVAGNYGAFWRNDGGNVWLLSTNAGDQYGGWSAFRPFQYNLTSGDTTIASTIFAKNAGDVSIGGASYYGKFTVRGNDDVASLVSAGNNAYLRLSINNDITTRLELANRNGRTALYNTTTGDAFNIIHASGNVGIGTSTPKSKLDVGGEITSRYLNDGAGVYSQFRAIWGRYGFMIRNDGNKTYFLLTNPNDQQSQGNGFRPFTIDNTSGNVTLSKIGTNGFDPVVGMPANWGGGIHTYDVYAEGSIGVGPGNGLLNGYFNRDGNLWAKGSVTIDSGLTVGNDNGKSATIAMRDDESPNGLKYIHSNSNNIGFLSGQFGWLVRWDNAGNMVNSGNISGANIYASNYYYTSDKRLKKDIVPIVSPLEKIKALSGYTFAWKDTGVKSVGLIAQEVEKIFPELVGETQTASGMTIKTVQYGNLVAPLIESVKELSRLHDEDTKKISDLEEEIQAMHADIEQLRIQIQK